MTNKVERGVRAVLRAAGWLLICGPVTYTAWLVARGEQPSRWLLAGILFGLVALTVVWVHEDQVQDEGEA